VPTDYTPVWFMRQAGRSLPEYRAARGSGSIIDAVRSPDLAAELTLQPVRRYGVDAAILFSDIVVPLAAIGFGVEIHPGIGPVIEKPFRQLSDLDRLRPFDPIADTPYVLETIEILRRELRVPLIGFAGAPFTLASYLIEGGPSRDFIKTKTLMYGDPSLWRALVDQLADITLASLRAQVSAGAQAVQLFDSWVGALSPSDYRRFAFDASSKVLRGLSDLRVPTIHFGVGTGELLAAMAESGASVVGVDWRVPLDTARRRIGAQITVQGNLDPAVLLAGWEVTKDRALEVLELGGGRRHVFNLGHGVLPGTDPDILARVVDLCHARAVRP
jgi:uroporphyrinogen decarboxylase